MPSIITVSSFGSAAHATVGIIAIKKSNSIALSGLRTEPLQRRTLAERTLICCMKS